MQVWCSRGADLPKMAEGSRRYDDPETTKLRVDDNYRVNGGGFLEFLGPGSDGEKFLS